MRLGGWSWAASIIAASLFLPLSVSADTCPGRREHLANTKIVGGIEARLAHWPAFAALRLKEPAGERAYYFCGGTAVASGWVLTAAHCVADLSLSQSGEYVKSADGLSGWRLEVVLGTDSLGSVTSSHVHAVDKLVVREGYTNPSKSGNDLALLHLARAWDGPVGRLSLSSPERDDSMSFAAGFGTLRSGQQPDWKKVANGETILAASATLREVMLPLVKTSACKAAYQGKPAYKDAKIGSEQICAGYDRGRKDTCQGDSGGPLVHYDRDNCPIQIGVVSWGDGCAAAKAYGVYARVSAHRDWIVKHVPQAGDAPLVVASNQTAIKDRQLAAAVELLEKQLATSKGRVRISVARGNRLKLGGLASFQVESDVSGRLIVLDVNAGGEVVQIFPNRHVVNGQANLIEKSKKILIPDPTNAAYRGLSGFRAVEPPGRGRLVAIVAPREIPVSEFVEAPERITKGFVAEGAPVSYVLNLFDQLAAGYAIVGGHEHWAIGEASYEIVR